MIYRISEFADKCGVNKETIRYYERKNLLQEPHRTEAGYRIYSYDDVKRVGFIKRIQELGFSLNEIYKLLGVVDKDEVRCQDMFRSEEHTSELQSRGHLVCRLLLEKKNK